MKKIIPFIICFCSSVAFAQTAFQGKVIHKFITEREDQNGTVEVFYGDQKLKGIKKVTFMGKAIPDDDLVIDFAKGIMYYINPGAKTYRVDSLKNKKNNTLPALVKDASKNTMMLNHSCSAFVLDTTQKDASLKDMSFIFWYADSLNFPVDEQYIHSDDLTLFTNGKTIGMGAAIKMDLFNEKKTLSLTPVSVEAMQMPDSLFEIPKGYVLETPVIQKPAAKPGQKKTPLKPAQKKAVVKSPVTRRKE